MSEDKKIAELRNSLQEAPGAPEFVELAELLAENPEFRPEAREVCFRGLTADPHNLVGRLTLARLFYLDGLGEFCVRELVELRRQNPAPAVDKLLKSFGGFAEAFLDGASSVASTETSNVSETEEDTVAEIDLDVEFEEALDELTKESA
ncbi:MAG: hypothetical protein KDD69_13505 [Bdellovibrionales bacterium]|nr:hypothetical protein [Bdellovibrionales bacterium]